MKKVLFLSLVFGLSIAGASAQNKWEDLIYHYQTGSVPPPYYFSYDLTISSSGAGTLVYTPDYGEQSTWVYNITFTESDMSKLDEAITASNILNEEIPGVPDSLKPIGGALQNISIQLQQDPSLDQVPPRIVTPFFPPGQFKDKLDEIYTIIQKMVPDNIWNEINSRKEEFIKSREK